MSINLPGHRVFGEKSLRYSLKPEELESAQVYLAEHAVNRAPIPALGGGTGSGSIVGELQIQTTSETFKITVSVVGFHLDTDYANHKQVFWCGPLSRLIDEIYERECGASITYNAHESLAASHKARLLAVSGFDDERHLRNVPNLGGSIQADFETLINLIEATLGEQDERPPEPFDPPLTKAEIASVIEQSVRHALTAPSLQMTRDFYGTPGNKNVVLVDDWRIKWPSGFRPEMDGLILRFGSVSQTGVDSDRVLGIRLDRLDIRAPASGIFDGNVTLTIGNAGGTRNGAVQGGCSVNYVLRRDGDELAVRCVGALDP